MSIKNLRITFAFLIAALPVRSSTGQVKFTTVVSSQELGLNDYLQVEFVVENARQIDELTPPDFPGFHIAQGPIQSSGMSVINGNTSQYKGLSFVLQPVRTGKFTIPGASAVVDGRRMRSNTVVIIVRSGGSGAAPANPGAAGGSHPLLQPFGADPFGPEPEEVDRDYILKPGENVKDKIRKNLFVKIQVDRNSCYVGEPIVATYKLYSRLSSESRVTKRPSLNGFSVYDMVDPSSDAVSVERLNGKAYTVHIIRKTQLIPLQAGNIDLDPVEVENTVHFVKGGARQGFRHSGNSLQDLIDQLNDNNNTGPQIDENVTLDTKPYTITVKPLPEENKPRGFNGAVGKFSIEASLAEKSIAAQDEATLRLVVKGKGNLPVITAPAVSWPSGIEAFDPTAKEDVNRTVAPMSGSKTFDYIFTAKTPGHYTIPSVNFSYFDPSTQSYKMADSKPLELQVMPLAKKTKTLPDNLAPATTSPASFGRLRHFIREHLEWLFAILLLSAVIFYFWRQNLRLKKDGAGGKGSLSARAGMETSATRQGHEPETTRLNQSGTVSGSTYLPIPEQRVDPLLEAKQNFDNGDYKGFYREVNRAIWKAIVRKLDLPASELNKLNCIRQLQLRGWDAPSILSLENILNECEMNLYTPDYDTYNMQQLLRQAEWMLDRLV